MKLVIRLLGDDGQLLGWCEHQAAVKGDGCLRANGPVMLTTDLSGRPDQVSVHWADVNVETRVRYPLTGGWVPAGRPLLLYPGGEVLIRCGPMAGGLPPTTTKAPVAVQPLTGALGAVSHA